MKKRKLIFLLPIAAMALGACGNKEESKDEPGQQEEGGGGGGEQETVSLAIKNKANFELEVEATKQLEAELKGATGDLTWSSSAVAVATVDATGKVTAVAPGEATITVKFGEKEDSVVVTVKAKQEETDYGSVESPITVAAAKAIIDAECDASDKFTKQAIVVKGFVSKIIKEYSYTEGPSVEFNLSDGTNEVYVYRCLTTAEAKANLSVGSEVVVKAFAKNFKGTKEMCDNGDTKSQFVSIAASTKVLASIESVAGPAEVTQNATVLTDSVSVVVVYEDGFKGTVHPDSIDLDTSVGGEVTATAHVGELTKTFTVTVIAPKENKFAEAYAAAKALSSGETAEFYFEGVVVGKRGDDTFIQNDGYGIDVYKSPVSAEVGDKVGVTSTLQNFRGMPETKTIKSVEFLAKASVPEAAKITSKVVHEALNISVLCEIEAQVKTLPAFNNADYTFKLAIGDDEFNVFVKKAVYPSFQAVFSTLSVGDDVKLSDAITGINNTELQIGVANTSSLEKIVHAVTGVTLDKETLSMEVGSAPQTLVATIAPENATNKSVTWESSNPAAATVENGVVTAVAQGEATITVKTVDGEKTAECVVTVTAATKTMTSISVEGPDKVEYTEGELLDLTGLVVRAHYDDLSSEVISAGYTTSIENGTALTTADTSFTVTYGTFTSDPIALTINEKASIVAEGYYNISSIADGTTYYLQSNGSSAAPSAVTDVTKATVFKFTLVEGTLDTYEITLAEDSSKYLYATNGNNGLRVGTTKDTWVISEGTIEGTGDFDMVDTAQSRYLSLYNKQDFRSYLSSSASSLKSASLVEAEFKEVSKIEVTTGPDKTTYYVGEEFDPTGMVVHVTYTDSSEENITEGFTWSPKSFEAVNAEKDITITYREKNAHIKVAVVEDDRTIESIKIDETSALEKTSYNSGESWDATGVKVIGVRNDSTEVELKADVTFSFDTEKAAVGVTQLTVTAKYNNGSTDLTASKTFAVTVIDASTTQVKTFTSSKDTFGVGTSTDARTYDDINGIAFAVAGLKNGSKADANYGYFMLNNGYIASTSAPSGMYISKVVVTYTSGTGTSGKIITTLTSTAMIEKSGVETTDSKVNAVTKSGVYTVENTDDSLIYFNVSNITTSNAQIATIEVTYSAK